MTVSMGTATRRLLQFCVRDGNTAADTTTHHGNPIMSGSTIVGTASIDKVSVEIDNSPIPDAVAGPTLHTVTIKNTSSPLVALSAGGSIDVKFTMGGQTFTLLDAITVNP
jgi:hypothetical protein